MFLEQVEKPLSRALSDLAVADMREVGVTLVEGVQTSIGGLDAFIGTYNGEIRDIGHATAQVAHIDYGREVYSVGGIARSELYPRVEQDFLSSIRSFRSLSSADGNNVSLNRVGIYLVQPGDNWQSLAHGPGEEIVEPTTLAIMNGYSVKEKPRSGDQIKIITAGQTYR